MNESNVEQIIVPNYEEKPKKKKGKVVLIILLLLIAGSIGLYFGYQKLNSNPLSIYKKAINTTYELLDGYLKDNLETKFQLNPYEESFSLNTNFSVETSIEDLKKLNDYNYGFNIGIDYKNNILNLNANIKEENEQIIGLLALLKNNSLYLASDELFSKVVKIDSFNYELDQEEINELQNYKIEYEYIHTVLTKLKNILINSLDEEKFDMSNETIEIDGKEIESKKISYILDKENLERTYNYFKDQITNDEELINAISEITNLSKDEITSIFTEDLDLSDYENITINLYAKNNQIIAGNIIVEEELITRFTYEDKEFKLYMGDEYTNIDLVYKNNTLEIKYYEYDEEIYSLSFTDKKTSKEIKITTNEYGENNNIYLKLSNIKDSSNKVSSDIEFSYENKYYEDINAIKFKGAISIEKGQINSVDTNNAIDINSLTEEEQTEIMNNLLRVIEKLDLEDLANSL